MADGGSTTTSESNPLTILQELTGYGNPFGTTGSSASTPFWQRLSPGVMRGHGAGTYAKGGQTQAPNEGPPVVGGLSGPGAGQADDIPAQLSHGEYVMDADVVSALGDGNNEAGANKLDSFREAIRAHKRSAPNDKIPPKAKPLGAYLPKR